LSVLTQGHRKIFTYKKGVSLLFRDSLEVSTPPPTSPIAGTEPVASTEHHVCVTDHRATVRERVGDMLFEFQGGSFFQNNNSVLIPLVDYVRTAIFGPQDTATSISTPPTHLVDAYCGSGLFAITLAPHFSKVAGIEISSEAIRSATHNATLNSTRIPASTELSFRAGDAADIFAVVGDFPPERTAVLIDPPRKGTDARFIEQLIALGPQTIVYVSCNVHTQARDVGMMLRMGKEKGVNYIFESVRGFDLFPQTAHVESVAILRKVSAEPTA
jgi:tRNA (uracil-5-)-methyltransferase